MMPGGRGNPKQMQAMMKRMGVKMDEIDDVEEVIIVTLNRELRIKHPSVSVVEAQGQKTYQIVGDAKEYPRSDAPAPSSDSKTTDEYAIPEEDIDLVVAQTGVSPEQARAALEECDGELAEAILKIMSG